MSRKSKLRLAGFYKKISTERICTYCGMPSYGYDHVLPVNFASIMSEIGIINHDAKIMVPSCTECNSAAGAKVFPSLAAKRRYIRVRIRRKYKKYLALPEWSEADLQELSHTLRTMVDAGLKIRNLTRQRLRWKPL